MWEKIRVVFTIPELRQKILLTLLLLAVYRMGFSIPLPFIDQQAAFEGMRDLQKQQGGLGQVVQLVSLFSASNISQGTIFGLGIMPYISASIIFELLSSVYPPLQQLKKEGEAGRRKINEYTRYATVLICLVQSYMLMRALASGFGSDKSFIMNDYNHLFFHMNLNPKLITLKL